MHVALDMAEWHTAELRYKKLHAPKREYTEESQETVFVPSDMLPCRHLIHHHSVTFVLLTLASSPFATCSFREDIFVRLHTQSGPLGLDIS